MVSDLSGNEVDSGQTGRAPACGCFGSKGGESIRKREDGIDAGFFARCYCESYLITARRNLPLPKEGC